LISAVGSSDLRVFFFFFTDSRIALFHACLFSTGGETK